MLLVHTINFSCASDVKDLLDNFIDTLSSEINEVIELPQNVSELFFRTNVIAAKNRYKLIWIQYLHFPIFLGLFE